MLALFTPGVRLDYLHVDMEWGRGALLILCRLYLPYSVSLHFHFNPLSRKAQNRLDQFGNKYIFVIRECEWEKMIISY